MEFEKVAYLDSQLWKINKNSPLQHEAMLLLHGRFGTLKDKKAPPFFPGPQPVSVERRHFTQLKKRNYVVCEKTDGVRHVMMCFTYQDKNMCIITNRNLDMYLVNLRIPTSAYESKVILDGEIVKSHEGRWMFMVYDIVIPGNFPERFKTADKIVSKIMNVSKNIFVVKLKKFFKLKQFSELQDVKFPYHVDGYVFTPEDEPIKVGTHETMFKWKPLIQNTIDFQMKKRPNSDNWGMYLQEKGVLMYENEISPDECPPEFMVEDLIAECMYVPEHQSWFPIKIRDDKNFPNARRTFYRTLVNLKEDIQSNEFIWKK